MRYFCHARLGLVGNVCLLVLAVLLVLAGCSRPFARPTQSQPHPPDLAAPNLLPDEPVVLTIQRKGAIQSGDAVAIRVAADDPAATDALRLAIDGADTGWRAQDSLAEGILNFEWTAGEPDTYTIVAQARATDGTVLENRKTLLVIAPLSSPMPSPMPSTMSSPVGAPTPLPGTPATSEPGDSESPNSEAQSLELHSPELHSPELHSSHAVPSATPDPADAHEEPAELPRIWETSLTLPTYPYWDFQTPAFDADYQWAYSRFDPAAFAAADPAPQAKTYAAWVLENQHLRIWLLPELGGRIWQVEHKTTGAGMFYQNSVVKPSPWGPPQQKGWLALGGMEWGAPVVEHGYDWGTPWQIQTSSMPDGALRAQLTAPAEDRLLIVEIVVTLPPDAAYFQVSPRIHNRSAQTLAYDFWLNAMLAPGPDNTPSADTHFVMPGRLVQVHSRGDGRLPGDARPLRWPHSGAQNLARLGDYRHYMGFFEFPQAQGPFVGVYDRAADAGAVRTYPAEIARGSKIFTLGWGDPIPSHYYTDDDSAYVELHGGVAPSFFDQATLAPGASTQWHERWYPVHGMVDLTYADTWGAMHVELDGPLSGNPNGNLSRNLIVHLYAVQPAIGEVQLLQGSRVLARRTFAAAAGAPTQVEFSALWPHDHLTEIRVVGQAEQILLRYYPGLN